MRAVLIASLLFSLACASSRATAPVSAPEILIAQTSGVPSAARGVTGPIPVRYGVRVTNTAAEEITLRRITVQSIGSGAYDLRSTSMPFDVAIPPGLSREVEFWASASIANASILGANGPVTLRVIAHFESPKGEFDEISVQQVNAGLTGDEPR